MSTTLSPKANRGSTSVCSFIIKVVSGPRRSPGVTSVFSKMSWPASSPPNGSASGTRAPATSTLTTPWVRVERPTSGVTHEIPSSQNRLVSATLSTTRPGGTTSSPGSGTSLIQGAPRRRPPDAARSKGPNVSWPSKRRTSIAPRSIWKPSISAAAHVADVSAERLRSHPPADVAGGFTGSVTGASRGSLFACSRPRMVESQSFGSGTVPVPSPCAARVSPRAATAGGQSGASACATVSSGTRTITGRAPAPVIRSRPPVQGMSSRETRSQS